jgi:hypothetical protein
MPHRTGLCGAQIIPARVVRVAPPAGALVRSGESLTPPWQSFPQENRYYPGEIGYPRFADVHDSCCFRGTLPCPLPGLDRHPRVSTHAYWCRLVSTFPSREARHLSLRDSKTSSVGVLAIGHRDALRHALAAGSLYLSSTSGTVGFEQSFAPAKGGEQLCLQPTAPCPTCVRRNSPRPCASRPELWADGGRKATGPHSSSAAAWSGTPSRVWIPGHATTAAQPHKARTLKKHARRSFFRGEGPPRVSKAKRVTSPQLAPTTVDPTCQSEVPVSHTLARPTPQFTPCPGTELITFPQISAHQVIR